MKPYLYVSLLPEALIASHLDPAAFGNYLATGSRKHGRGQALFFRMSDDYTLAQLEAHGLDPDLERGDTNIPRHSSYLSIYRVLEATPLEAIETLHVVTDDGRVLDLAAADYFPDPGPRFHLYQEFSPASPRVVSINAPIDFGREITTADARVSLPTFVFAELELGRLADDPEADGVENLPYLHLEHLRDCLRELRSHPGKTTKTVIRSLQCDVLFRTVHRGFYIAKTGGGFRFFPLPDRESLETKHYPWWRSALSTFGA
ncbi:hypothetical protein [Synoicihabitans lomoniglobus]|uniref:Uncharacterized protein n=1 Tax=Synoicihabitans lomoniglobus TaxID=2909285 RepID=A0AAF0CPW4_9BACT|nr:hypothetical protein [Opitutaceae bacterium LMO-M01]WED65854.1 hypothetical protein PXH66_03200 [Opitutaceae bacterium LMO-M01]